MDKERQAMQKAVRDTAKSASEAVAGKIRAIVREELDKVIAPTVKASNERIVEQAILRMIAEPRVEANMVFKACEDRLRAFPDLVLRLKTHDFYYPSGHSRSVSLNLRHGRLPQSEAEEVIDRVAAERRARDEEEVATIKRAWAQVMDDDGAEYVRRYYFEGESREHIAEAEHCDATTIWRKSRPIVKRIAIILYGTAAI